MGYQTQFLGDALSSTAGASAEAIQFHYDVGTDFFRTWLGEDLVYSAARWHEPLSGRGCAANLEAAQQNKIDFHLRAVRAGEGRSVLDIGCGWGALLRRAVRTFGSREAIGATLSAEQFNYVSSHNIPRTRVHLQSYERLSLPSPVDAVVSIGAFEHFAKPSLSRDRKVAIYRGFFDRVHGFLRYGGRLSLQSIFWQDVDRDEAAKIVPVGVFPESDLPYLDEIFEGAQGAFRTVYMEACGDDYVLT
ncbi:MAG: class I SAM-dependent methyltransferase, partial [Alphaproteobacteria bacterium]|nr:class I SAM-dependent methyltransferase [Alphaproteobacteria bacterium]